MSIMSTKGQTRAVALMACFSFHVRVLKNEVEGILLHFKLWIELCCFKCFRVRKEKLGVTKCATMKRCTAVELSCVAVFKLLSFILFESNLNVIVFNK